MVAIVYLGTLTLPSCQHLSPFLKVYPIFSNGFTVRDSLNSLSFTAMLQDILFLLWNTKIYSLDDCFKKEAVTANKSGFSVLFPVDM